MCWGVPGGVVFDEGVEDGEEFPHAGGDAELVGFALLGEPLGELSDDGVAAGGVEGGHVEGAADASPPAADPSGFGGMSAVLVDGRDADEGGDLLAVDLAEFGELGDERDGRDGSDSGDAGQEVVELAPVGVGGAEFGDVFVEVFDSLLEQFDELLNVAAHGGIAGGFEVVFLLSEEFDDLASAGDEGVELPLIFGRFGAETEVFGVLGIADQQAGVEGVGFGEPSEAGGEVADAIGRDDGDGVFPFGEEEEELGVVDAGGFEDDLTGVRGRELGEQRLEPLGGVGDAEQAGGLG